MINTLEDLQVYIAEYAMRFPPDARPRFLLRRSSIAVKDLVRLRSALNLPESYLACLRRFDLEGVSIGYFQVWPQAPGTDIVDRIMAANGSINPRLDYLQKERLYEVAGWDADHICVASQSSSMPGRVYWMADELPDSSAHPIATSFSEFLIAAGRLVQVGAQGDGQELLETFLSDLGNIMADVSLVGAWRMFAESALLG